MHFIDTLVSSSFWMTAIIMVWTFLFVGLSFLNPFRKKGLNMLYKALMYGVAGSIFLFIFLTHYGLAYGFEKMTMGKNTICLLDQYERGSRGPSESVTRLHVLDKATGERRTRLYLGWDGRLLGQKGDTVAYFYDRDLHVMNAGTLKEISRTLENEWLADGVESVSTNQNYDQPHKPYVVIKGKNGNTYWCDPFSPKKDLLTASPKDQEIPGIYSKNYEINDAPADGSYEHTILDRRELTDTERKQIVPGDHYQKLFGPASDETFIEPGFLCIDMEKKFFVFRHYRTTDRDNMWIEAKDFNFKTLWKKDGKALDASDGYGKEKIDVAQLENGLLYFNMGGFMLCLEPMRGKVKWKVRL